MEQSIIDPNNPEKQLYYPPSDYKIESEYIVPQEDSHFRDLTISYINEDVNQNSDQNCCIRLSNWCDNMKKITRIESFTFTLEDITFFPIFIKFAVVLTILIIICISFNKSIEDILINIAVALIACTVLVLFTGCYVVYKIILKLEQNSIVLIKRCMLNTKTTIYKSGELEKVEIYYVHAGKHDKNNHVYNFYFIKKTGNREKFHKIICSKGDEDFKGVKYFIDLINQYIQNNMN